MNGDKSRLTSKPSKPSQPTTQDATISVFVCGDVMTGRGIDQALLYPGNPILYEPHIRDAREYVRLAERVNGPIARPVDYAYIWGSALEQLEQAHVDVRIINLETSVTSCADAWPGKEIHYRMHPRNIGCLTSARIDCCCLANNHVLDWGYAGLTETLQTLDHAGIARAGAGHNAEEAASPARLDVPGKGRVLVFSLGSTTAGIPSQWAATEDSAGVNVLKDLSEQTAWRVASQIGETKRAGDVVLASIHWAGNWGYDIPEEQIRFAHRLVEEGVDIVHGHSSHHVKALEVHRDRPILYGCGDFVDDYEGISGYEEFRNDLRLIYVLRVDPGDGRLEEARLYPMQASRFRLNSASEADTRWLCGLLNTLGAPLGTHVALDCDNSMVLRR